MTYKLDIILMLASTDDDKIRLSVCKTGNTEICIFSSKTRIVNVLFALLLQNDVWKKESIIPMF